MGDIYSKGSWGILNNTSYKVKYKYNGNVQLNYRMIKQAKKVLKTILHQMNFLLSGVTIKIPKQILAQHSEPI